MSQAIRWSMRVVVLAGWIGFAAVGARGQATTLPSSTRPADGGVRRPGVIFVVERLKRMVNQLELSSDQKSKVAGIFDQATQQAQDLAQSMRDDSPQDRYQKVQDFGKQLRGQLEDVLTDDQKQALGQKLGGGAGNGGAGGVRGGGILENLQQALTKLDLSDDQKQQVKDLMESTRQQVADLRKKAANGDNIQADMQQIRQDVRAKLQTILSPEQMQALTTAIQQARQNRGGNGSAPPQPAAANAAGPTEPAKPADLQTSGPEVGAAASDVKLVELSGNTLMPSKYRGHVLVLEFGSFSCPVFRDHVQAMEKLKALEGPRAFFVVVYTREAFPAGDKDVERNKDQSVSVPLAANLEERKMQARETQRNLRITIPMAVDSMDDAVSIAFGGFPNGAVVIGKDGNIAAREQWTNPDSLRRAIDEANEGASTQPGR